MPSLMGTKDTKEGRTFLWQVYTPFQPQEVPIMMAAVVQVLGQVGTLRVKVEPVPLADVEAAWSRVEKGRRIVFTTPKI